ncbi:MAG: hypothetical protein HYS27_08860 [Deltaproteobacteria bacterium]|nr:hypothetical protein [Deltaproteobacteria bacterium]
MPTYLLFLPWTLYLAAPGDAAPVAEVAQVAEPEAFLDEAWLVGAEGVRVRRTTSTTSATELGLDEDARFSLDGGARALGGRLRLDGAAELYWDVDGARPDGDAGLRSVHDSRGPLELLVHTLELGWGGGPLVQRAAIGRLTVEEGWPITLDGVALSVSPLAGLADDELYGARRSRAFVSAGRTVHFYETGSADAELFEDWAVSAGVDLVTADAIKLQLDVRGLFEDSATGGFDGSAGAALFLRALDVAQGKAWLRTLDDQVMVTGARVRLGGPGDDLGADVEASLQPATLGEVALAADPYFLVLGESLPHWRARADVFAGTDLGLAKGTLHAGAQARVNVVDDEQAFNRNSGRVYALAQATDLLVPGVFVSADVAWDSVLAPGPADLLGASDGRVALGGSVGYQRAGVRAELGTAWDRYKYTYYQDVEELADVRTIYGAVGVRALQWLRVQARASVEVFDRTETTVQVTLVQDLGVTR